MKCFKIRWILFLLLGLNSIHVYGAMPKGEYLKTESETHEFHHHRVVIPQSFGRPLVWHKLRIRQKNFHNFLFDEEFNYWLDSTNSFSFELLDINLDGYSDFVVHNFEQKQFYIYEPTKHQFKHNQWLSCASRWSYNAQKSSILIALYHGEIIQKIILNLPSMATESVFQFSAMATDSVEISESLLKCPLTFLSHKRYQQPKLDEINFDKVKVTPQKFHFFMSDSVNIVLYDQKLINQLSKSKIIIEQYNEHYQIWEEYKLQTLFEGQKNQIINGKCIIFLGFCDESAYPLFSGYSFIVGHYRIKLVSNAKLVAQSDTFFVHR